MSDEITTGRYDIVLYKAGDCPVLIAIVLGYL